jgi:hypothetical protein
LQEDVGKLKETLSELGDIEDKRLSGLRTEREDLTRELHSTRRAVSIDFRNREQKRLQKLAVYTEELERAVDEILLNQDQMIKLSQNCLKMEQQEDELTKIALGNMELTDDERHLIRKVDQSVSKDKLQKGGGGADDHFRDCKSYMGIEVIQGAGGGALKKV